MRHVRYDPKKISYPDGWLEKAKAAKERVASSPEDKRSEEVKKNSALWAALKPELAKIMNGKCWYTEAPQAGTDTDVDHFRPKNSVKGVSRPIPESDKSEAHPGYWWLAFEPSNYRLSCIVANRPRRDIETGHLGGKVDEFPISNEDQRAWTPDDDYKEEQPLLIDPCNLAEVALITFAQNGEAIESHSKAEMPRLYEKAHRSIALYHLNHTDFVKARQAIRDKLMQSIEDAQRYYQKLDTADADVENAYMRAIQMLREACDIGAPFSGFAVAILKPYRMEASLAPVFA